jgi:hypothetical protein
MSASISGAIGSTCRPRIASGSGSARTIFAPAGRPTGSGP